MTDGRKDEYPEVIIDTPDLTVTVRASTTLAEARRTAQEIFEAYRKPDSRLGATGFVIPERGDVSGVEPRVVPVVARDVPEAGGE